MFCLEIGEYLAELRSYYHCWEKKLKNQVSKTTDLTPVIRFYVTVPFTRDEKAENKMRAYTFELQFLGLQ